MAYKINLEDILCRAEAIYYQILNSCCSSDIIQPILGIEPSYPGPSTEKSKLINKPLKPPGFAVPVKKEDGTQAIKENTSSENASEFTQVEKHLKSSFDVFS